MRFTQSVDLALHALWYMARNAPDRPIQTKDIARAMRASESYLARIMHWLARAGILQSIRGKNGGFMFKQPPHSITIADVLTAIDSDAAKYDCPWQERGCELHNGCSLVSLFHEAQQQMIQVLQRMTIAEIAASEQDAQNRSQWLSGDACTSKADSLNCPAAQR